MSYVFGQSIDWSADLTPIVLFVELPFWLMTPSYTFDVHEAGHTYKVDVTDAFGELFAGEATDSRRTSLYIGPMDYERIPGPLQEEIERREMPVLWRPCKTVVRVHSRANSDVLDALTDDTHFPRAREVEHYLRALCETHLPILNRLIQSYRLATYDYFAHEVSPWDVPLWYVHRPSAGFERVVLLDYASWDRKPQIGPLGGELETYQLTIPPDLQGALDGLAPTAGELELLDALNLMERGDYSGAVRRVTTAIEAIVEDVLRSQLRARHPADEVESRLTTSRNDFPGRVRQYCKLSGRRLPEQFDDELERTRATRHAIVHGAHRIPFVDRGSAQRSVDTGRWIFNWFEDRPDRSAARERLIATRSVGRHTTLFDAELTEEGAVVRGFNPLPGGAP